MPFPDYADIDLDAYQQFKTMTGLRPKGKATSLFTTRGCFFRCTYCHDHFGKKVRKRSLDNVISEMDRLMTRKGVTGFQIIDDIFNADRPRAIELSDHYGIFTSTFTMFGFPTETREEMQMTVDYLLAWAAHCALMFQVQPYEGTEIRDQVGMLTSGVMEGELTFSPAPGNPDEWFTEVPQSEMRALILDTMKRFHFNETRLRRVIDLTQTCHAKPALAEYLHFTMSECGMILRDMPESPVRRMLADLLRHEGPVPYERWQPPFVPEIHALPV